jgi:hypothetical protein
MGPMLGHPIYQFFFPSLYHRVNQATPMDHVCHLTPLMHQPLVLQVLPNWAPWVFASFVELQGILGAVSFAKL